MFREMRKAKHGTTRMVLGLLYLRRFGVKGMCLLLSPLHDSSFLLRSKPKHDSVILLYRADHPLSPLV